MSNKGCDEPVRKNTFVLRLSWKYQFIKRKYLRKASNFRVFFLRLFVAEKQVQDVFTALAKLQTHYKGVVMDKRHKCPGRFLNVFYNSIYVLCPRGCRGSLKTDWTNFFPNESLETNWCIKNAFFARVSWLFLQEFNPFHTIGLFLYPRKTSENQRFSVVTRGFLLFSEGIEKDQWYEMG